MSNANMNMGPGAIGPGGEGPSRAYYILAGIIFLTGFAVFGLFLFKSIKDMRDGLTQVVVPGSREVELAKAGTYTIFHEYRSVVEGKVYGSPPSISGLKVTVTSEADGAEVPLGPLSASAKYDVGSRSGYGLFNFTIASPGTYVVSGEYEDPHSAGGETVLTIGQGFIANLLFTIFGAIGVLFAAIAACAVIVVVTAVKRSRARTRAIAQ